MPLINSQIEDVFTTREEHIKSLLGALLNINLQYEDNERVIVNTINKFLSTTAQRREGLEYLELIISNCKSSVIVDNALNWTSHCVSKFSEDPLKELRLRVLEKIIDIAHNESDFNKKFVSDYISKVVDSCTITSHLNIYECKAALKTLTICMKCYPNWFNLQRQKIENYLVIFLDSDNEDLVYNAGVAFHYFQQTGTAGANGLNHKSNFTQNFHKLCRTAQKLYDNIFENETELLHTDKSDGDYFEFQDDPTFNNQMLLYMNSRRMLNVFKFIEVMIVKGFPVAKETKPKEILNIITRGCMFHKCITGDNIESLISHQFALLLVQIQTAVLKLLKLFIIWYQTNILPFSYTISKIITESLDRTHNCDCFKNDSLYQESSYRALIEWLSVSKGSLHTDFQSQLLTSILKDITPVKSQVTLTISEVNLGKKSEKAKRKAMVSRIVSSGNQSTDAKTSTYFEKNNEKNVCLFALKALKHLLEFTQLNVKPALLQDLFKSIFDSLISVQSSKPLYPYTDPQCEVELYEVLVAIYHQNNLPVLPPLQTSLNILTRGINNDNKLLSNVCERGIKLLEVLCQPICPSLYLGIEGYDGISLEVKKTMDIEEIIVEEDKSIDEASSVDYDASTDEFPLNSTNMQDDSVIFASKDLEEDHAPVNEAEVDLEELPPDQGSLNTSQVINEEINLNEVPVLDKEENNVLENEDIEGTTDQNKENIKELEEIITKSSQHSVEGEIGNFTKGPVNEDIQNSTDQEEILVINSVEIEISTIDNTRHDEASENNPEENRDSASENTKEETVINSETIQVPVEGNTVKDEELIDVDSIEDNLRNNAQDQEISSSQIHPDEPTAKRVKLVQEDDDMGDVFSESFEIKEEKDCSFLEDSSFVDEVKD